MSLARPLLAALALLLSAALPAQQYTVEDLGTLSATPTDRVRATAINNRGQIHGEGDRTDPVGGGIQWRAFFWSDGNLERIDPPQHGATWNGDLNDSGVCVGHFTDIGQGLPGFHWRGGVFTPFTVGSQGHTRPTGINAEGAQSGTYLSDTSVGGVLRYHAYLRDPSGAVIDLGTLGGMDSAAAAVNHRRRVVGKARDFGNRYQAYVWTPATGMMAQPGVGGGFAEARDINNFDQAVGGADNAAGFRQPVRWDRSGVTLLPTLGGVSGSVAALNDHGAAVGHSKDLSGQRLATLWQGGAPLDLNTTIPSGTGWVLTGASDINELGEISGNGLLNGLPRAFKLTPVLAAGRVSGFQPGFAGGRNTMFGLGFSPGATVEVYAGRQAGSTVTACGAVVAIGTAARIATRVADAEGRIEFERFLPASLGGQQVLYQTVEPARCSVGELRSQRLQ